MVGKGAPGISAINAWLDLVRVPPSGTWDRRRADRFALASEWIGPDPAPAKGEATAALVESYLRAFGPATPGEAADWAGLSIGEVKAALAGLELRRFRAEDGAELVDLPAPGAARRRDPGAGAAAAGLGRDRCSSTPAAARSCPRSIARRSSARRRRSRSPTFLVDGQVAGSLAVRQGQGGARAVRATGHGARRELEQEGERLASFAA